MDIAIHEVFYGRRLTKSSLITSETDTIQTTDTIFNVVEPVKNLSEDDAKEIIKQVIMGIR